MTIKQAVVVLVLSGALLGSTGCGWLGRAGSLVSDEVDPYALQHKYEWFKDASAQLDKKKADISVYERRFKTVGGSTGSCPQTLNRTASEQCFVWVQEVSGIIASYNSLAAEYNSEMAKWNWRFTNVGMLPQGADVPLPRDYKPYEY